MHQQQIDGRAAQRTGQSQPYGSAPIYGYARTSAAPAPYRRPAVQPAKHSAPPKFLEALFAAAVVLVIGGCITGFALASTTVDPTTGNAMVAGVGGVSTYGLPFAAGTSVSISKGPHSDNFGSVTGGYSFNGSGDVPASLDLAAPQGTAVKPVASGRVLSAWPDCNVVIVDHGDGVWAEYLHIQVTVNPGDPVDRNTTLGYLLGEYTGLANCRDHSTGSHLHFAFISGSGHSGTYVGIEGKVLCGHTVNHAGDIVGLGTVGGGPFVVPNCDTASQPIVTPTAKPIVTPTPKQVSTVTKGPTNPPGFCMIQSLNSPGSNVSFASTQDVSLSWSTNCSQAYAELSGAPYGTLSFGGWQSASSVHIGQMWPGTYTWHVKGKSYANIETSWSATWSFTIRSANAPIITDPPAAIITDPPATIVTDPPATIVTDPPTTKTPCPFKDGGDGVTFYTGANFSGKSWNWYVPAGNGDAYANLPSDLYRNLGSFKVSNNAWHVVLYQGDNGTGNLGHYDASWTNVDAYWHVTQSVKIYINRTSC